MVNPTHSDAPNGTEQDASGPEIVAQGAQEAPTTGDQAPADPTSARDRPVRPKRQPKARKSSGAPSWMTTYLDVTTLLLTFLVLMLASADFREQAFGMVGPTPIERTPTEDDQQAGDATVDRYLSLYNLEGYVRVVQFDGKDAFRFKDGYLFPQGETTLSEQQRDRLYLAHLFAIKRIFQSDMRVVVVGSAALDEPGALDLAAQRGLAVANLLIEFGAPENGISLRTTLSEPGTLAPTKLFATLRE